MGAGNNLDALITLVQHAGHHAQPLRARSTDCDRTLLDDLRLLEYQLQVLVAEYAALSLDDRDAHNNVWHKVRQLHERVQAHLDAINTRVVERASMELCREPHGLEPE